MKIPIVRAALTTAVIALTLVAMPGHAIAPLIALLGKQLLQDMVMTTAKSMLLDSLRGMGCKGTALANALGSVGGLQGGGLGMLRGMPAMPSIPGMPSGISAVPGLAGVTGMAGMGGLADLPPDIAAQMARMMPGGGLDAGQLSQLAEPRRAMGAPLSPSEAIATIDEMSELGMLSSAMSAELKECMLLLPQSAPAMGMAMGMMKPMLAKFREARDEMRSLPADEQDELAATLAQEFDKVPAADRKNMLTELRGGLFPPRVVDALTRRYGGQ